MGFGGSAVYFISEQDICEYWSRLETHLAFPFRGLLQDMGADDVAGHEVRGKLHSIKVETEQLSQCFDERGFPNAWYTFE